MKHHHNSIVAAAQKSTSFKRISIYWISNQWEKYWLSLKWNSRKFFFSEYSNLICLLIDIIPNFGAIHYRVLRTIVYLMLRLFYFPWEECQNTLKSLDLMSIKQCHLWAKTAMDKDDIWVILRDGRKIIKIMLSTKNIQI